MLRYRLRVLAAVSAILSPIGCAKGSAPPQAAPPVGGAATETEVTETTEVRENPDGTTTTTRTTKTASSTHTSVDVTTTETGSPHPSPSAPAPTISTRSTPSRSPTTTASAPEGGRLAGILAAHNRARAEHCAPPLRWSKKLTTYAQDWANSLRDRGCAFEHRQRSPHGENLAYLAPAGIGTPDNVTGGWVAERKDFNFSKPTFAMNTGHFTQVVWGSTKELGCAVATCGERAELWVCNYSPPGNMIGDFKKQVKPQGSCD